MQITIGLWSIPLLISLCIAAFIYHRSNDRGYYGFDVMALVDMFVGTILILVIWLIYFIALSLGMPT